MTGKKDQALNILISGINKNQASNILADAMKAKGKHAPYARANAFVGNKEDVGKHLSLDQNNTKKLGGGS